MQSRNIRPAIYGEEIHNCPNCQIVLRAWAVWRMSLHDWAERRLRRLRQVATDEAKVEADVRALGEADGLLDNAPLNGLLRAYIPNACRRLELAATAALGAEQRLLRALSAACVRHRLSSARTVNYGDDLLRVLCVSASCDCLVLGCSMRWRG